mmetsp:Transcript_14986/g.17065  ORF Transcript_14986/g.17065 Transcript_14986/m.17065 type:complete len:85 (-) Transcript_14986:676-930(-)
MLWSCRFRCPHQRHFLCSSVKVLPKFYRSSMKVSKFRQSSVNLPSKFLQYLPFNVTSIIVAIGKDSETSLFLKINFQNEQEQTF